MPAFQSSQVGILVVTSCFLVLTTVVCSLRAYTRWTIRGYGWDDAVMLLAQFVFIGMCIVLIDGTRYGFSINMLEIITTPGYRIWRVAKDFWLFFFLWTPALALTKVSVCLSMARVANKKSHLQIIHGVMGVTIAMAITGMILTICQCTPVSGAWSTTRHCRGHSYTLGQGTYNVIAPLMTDIAVACLPYLILRDLQVNKRTKRTLLVLMTIGILTSCATIARAFLVHEFLHWETILQTSTPSVLLNVVEVGVAITAGCIPTLRPLFKGFYEKKTTYAMSSRGQGTSSKPRAHSETSQEDILQGTGRIMMTNHIAVDEEFVGREEDKVDGRVYVSSSEWH